MVNYTLSVLASQKCCNSCNIPANHVLTVELGSNVTALPIASSAVIGGLVDLGSNITALPIAGSAVIIEPKSISGHSLSIANTMRSQTQQYPRISLRNYSPNKMSTMLCTAVRFINLINSL